MFFCSYAWVRKGLMEQHAYVDTTTGAGPFHSRREIINHEPTHEGIGLISPTANLDPLPVSYTHLTLPTKA